MVRRWVGSLKVSFIWFPSRVYLKMSHTPYTVTALGHSRCLLLLRWISTPFPLPGEVLCSEEILYGLPSFLFLCMVRGLSLQMQMCMFVSLQVPTLEIFPRSNCFLFLSSPEFEIGCLGNGCHLIHLINCKDDHYCAEKHFLNVFLMQIAYFLKCFINNWCNSKTEKWVHLGHFHASQDTALAFLCFLLPVNQII